MNISRPFILRPVATTLSMIAMLLCGLIAYKWLPVSSLPEVDYPTIQTTTFYPGASPEVMAALVTSPLERQFGQMPGSHPGDHRRQIRPAPDPGRRMLVAWRCDQRLQLQEHPVPASVPG